MIYTQKLYEEYIKACEGPHKMNTVIISYHLYVLLEREATSLGFISAKFPNSKIKYNEIFGCKLIVAENVDEPIFLREVRD